MVLWVVEYVVDFKNKYFIWSCKFDWTGVECIPVFPAFGK